MLALAAAAAKGWTEPADFPAEVHQSLAALQAYRQKGRDDPHIRFATPDELALANLLRDPRRCQANSIRTHLPCRHFPAFPDVVCVGHGAKLPAVKAANDRRLAALSASMIGELTKLAKGKKHTRVKLQAAIDLLDRAGVGAIAEAKVRGSYAKGHTGDVTLQIGFLTAPQIGATHGHDEASEQNEQIIEAQVEAGAALPAADRGTEPRDQDDADRGADRGVPPDAPGAAAGGD